jgi:hypothetical protein
MSHPGCESRRGLTDLKKICNILKETGSYILQGHTYMGLLIPYNYGGKAMQVKLKYVIV